MIGMQKLVRSNDGTAGCDCLLRACVSVGAWSRGLITWSDRQTTTAASAAAAETQCQSQNA